MSGVTQGVMGISVDQGQKDELESVRHQLLLLLQRGKRTLPKFRDMPTDWRAQQVINPNDPDQLPFTPNGAWHFIEEQLEQGRPIEAIRLDVPPGKTGYVMLVPVGPNTPDIYIKLQLGSGQVIGRSFHYSTRSSTVAETTE